MSNALKCDRCGKFYELNLLEDEKTVQKTVRGAVLQDRRGYTITEYDLCDECRDQLLDFLNP